jgi:hypothetical protein
VPATPPAHTVCNLAAQQENDLVRTPSIVARWTNFADRRDVVAIDAKLGDDYEPNDQGVKVADLPVINAYRSPLDRSPADKPNYHKSYGYLRTPEMSNEQYFSIDIVLAERVFVLFETQTV